MEDRVDEQVQRELSALRTQVRLVRLVAVVALLAALGAVGMLLVRPKPSRVVVADKVFASELNITQTPRELAEEMSRPRLDLTYSRVEHHPGVGIRPGVIAIRGWDDFKHSQLEAGSIGLDGGRGWDLVIGSDSSSIGLHLSAPDGRLWHFPDISARPRPR